MRLLFIILFVFNSVIAIINLYQDNTERITIDGLSILVAYLMAEHFNSKLPANE